MVGTNAALLHNLICREIVDRHNGSVIKELGDGVLVSFGDSLDACLAAVDIKRAIYGQSSFLTKGSLTIGEVEELEISGVRDILGAPVDRCARILSTAFAGQILIDSPLHAGVSSHLKDYLDVCVGPPEGLNLKDIGSITTYELSTKEIGLVGGRKIPFTIHEKGRLPIDQKVAFMQNAKREVIELGVGLTTFAEYFVSRGGYEFKDHVTRLLKRGVNFKCMLLDPNHKVARECRIDLAEPSLVNDIRSSIKGLKKQQGYFKSLKLDGIFEIYAYRRMPYFHAVCVDPETDDGRMTLSHYLHGVRRAETPVFQFCKAVNKDMFEKYWLSIKELLVGSKLL